jgi:AcrR family transcriptional regulator
MDMGSGIGDIESIGSGSALEAMLDGADAYFEAMSAPGRARLLLLEGPAVLGVTEMAEIDRRTGENELRQGLELVLQGEDSKAMPHGALSEVLSAAFDRAALAVVSGESPEEYRAALRILLTGIPGMKSKKS